MDCQVYNYKQQMICESELNSGSTYTSTSGDSQALANANQAYRMNGNHLYKVDACFKYEGVRDVVSGQATCQTELGCMDLTQIPTGCTKDLSNLNVLVD